MPPFIAHSTSQIARIDRLLRGSETESDRGTLRDVIVLLIAAGSWYGLVMGTYSGLGPLHWRQMIYSACKVPLMLTASFWLSLPSFFVLNSLFGLRPDFRRALAALVGAQAALTVILATLAPFTALYYVSGLEYNGAITFNGLMFAIASGGGQLVLRRSYRPLIAANPRHRVMLGAWLIIYVFVGIQMGWILRPFIGDPRLPTRFMRADALTNAYVSVARIVWASLR